MDERARIIVKGTVQGVGFRPYVYTLATCLGLRGFVTNTADGVLIDIEGEGLGEFIARLSAEAPPLASISDISIVRLPVFGYPDFTIRKSIDDSSAFTLVSPDVAVCSECLRELFDPADRRYLYPFINCTNCGPRYSITRSIPYDRPNTTMSVFKMCPDCEREYHDPRDRRFHAQPNACNVCGPHVEFKIQDSRFNIEQGEQPIQMAIRVLKQGGIVAIKGLGGFHIACDATNDKAVKRLRERKRKSNKPFAVMMPDLETAGQFCIVSDAEAGLLESMRRPIVLLRKRHDVDGILSDSVAPNNQYIGVMLPYTPLHYLLFHHPTEESKPEVLSSRLSSERAGPHFRALVMTSGNLSEEPIVHDNDDAVEKLSGIVDCFLLHNRDIFMRVDDSVVRTWMGGGGDIETGRQGDREKGGFDLSRRRIVSVSSGRVIFFRRARGYAPEPVPLQEDGPEVMGCGADLKNTFTLTKGTFAIPSQHIGDMENLETLIFFEESLNNLMKVYRVKPVAIAHDLHPGYISTKWAIEKGTRLEGQGSCNVIKTLGIQHHYAHIGSVMAEHGLKGPVIGVAFDGTGYGTDGNLWGGEFIKADISGFERLAHFRYIPLPGGEAAIRQPWRTAISFLADASGERLWEWLERLGFMERYGHDTVRQIIKILPNRDVSPLSSGCGRLFDAVSALLGICDTNTFEGEAAMALESLAREGVDDEYDIELYRKNGYTVVDFSSAIRHIVHDIVKKVDRHIISTRFHNTIVKTILSVVTDMTEQFKIMDVAISGGTFQNLYLLTRTVDKLKEKGMNVFVNQKVPCNDAGISLGQAYLLRERLKIIRLDNSDSEYEANAR